MPPDLTSRGVGRNDSGVALRSGGFRRLNVWRDAALNPNAERSFWIIGGGRFGRQAAEVLRHRHGSADILVVEIIPQRCRELADQGFRTLCGEGVAFLRRRLKPLPLDSGRWIVPSAPVHVAFEWLRAELSENAGVEVFPVPDEISNRLPNVVHGRQGEIFASNADFICPPDCPEAGRICTATGRRRPRSMHAFIQRLQLAGVKILVIRSFQLAPGVGALRPRDLFSALQEIRSHALPILLATACKCHAVLNSFRIISKS
jgi:hypothetical protein